jgi:hypothetical protein
MLPFVFSTGYVNIFIIIIITNFINIINIFINISIAARCQTNSSVECCPEHLEKFLPTLGLYGHINIINIINTIIIIIINIITINTINVLSIVAIATNCANWF